MMRYFQLIVYVPFSHLEDVKSAVFSVGGGVFGEYKNCSWQVLGQGQFLPLENSNPHIGKQGKVSKIEEFRLEIVCSEKVASACIDALKKSHPYETPLYYLLLHHI